MHSDQPMVLVRQTVARLKSNENIFDMKSMKSKILLSKFWLFDRVTFSSKFGFNDAWECS